MSILVLWVSDGKYLLKKSISNPILCQMIIVCSQKNFSICGKISSLVGAVSSSLIESPVMNHTICLSSSVFFVGLMSDLYSPIIFPCSSISMIPIWIGSSFVISSPVVSKSSQIYLYFLFNNIIFTLKSKLIN